MKQTYTVAGNTFTISISAENHAWQRLSRRFRPFASADSASAILEIEISTAPLPAYEAEKIYQPEHTGIGFIAASASQLADGSFLMEFIHTEEDKPRISLKMSAAFDRADIVMAPDGDEKDPYFLTHALMLAYMISTLHTGTLLIHSSSVICDGKAYLFQGKSGTGKSTHAALWIDTIPGAELLNDDNPVIRISREGVPMAYGSPWSGKTHCYRNVAAPIGAFVRIVRADHNELCRLDPLRAYASLTTSIFSLPFLPASLRDIRHDTLERIVTHTGCYEMHCLPESAAAIVCHSSLSPQSPCSPH